jgi:hypothetical protein
LIAGVAGYIAYENIHDVLLYGCFVWYALC